MKNMFNKPDVLFAIRDIIRETFMGNAALGLIISATFHFISKATISGLDVLLAVFLSASGVFIFLWLLATSAFNFSKFANLKSLPGIIIFMIWMLNAELVFTLTLLNLLGKSYLL